MQLVERVSRLPAQVPAQPLVLVQPTQDVLLDVTHHVRLAQVVQADLAEAGELACDEPALLARGADEEQPRREERVVPGEQLRYGAARRERGGVGRGAGGVVTINVACNLVGMF